MTKIAKWTLMLYMAGDNSLSAAGELNLDELRAVGSNDDVNILVLYDGFGDTGIERGRLEKNGRNEAIETLKELDTGDPQNLIGFVNWAVAHYPAERYGLVLWSHGSGWRPEQMRKIAQAVQAKDFSLQEASERSESAHGRIFFRSTLSAILSLDTPTERAICMDDATGQSLDILELGQTLTHICQRLGRPLDLLGMDACLMSNFEVAYQVRACAKFLVASEHLEPDRGWPYQVIVQQLVAQPDQDTREWAAFIPQAYVNALKPLGHPISLTTLNLALAESVCHSLNQFAEALALDLPGPVRDALWTAQSQTTAFLDNTLYDIAELCLRLQATPVQKQVKTAAKAIRAALKPGGFVLAHAHHGKRLKDCGGLSIYLPALVDISKYYARIAFSKDTRWLAMLRAYKSQ